MLLPPLEFSKSEYPCYWGNGEEQIHASVAQGDGYEVYCPTGQETSGPYVVWAPSWKAARKILGEYDALTLLIWRQNFELTRGSNKQESVT